MANILFKIARICHSQFKWYYVKNEKSFLHFLFHFWNLHQILNVLKGKMIITANALPKFQTVKYLVTKLSKRRRFRVPIESEHVKAFQILARSPWDPFYHVFLSFSGELIWKLSPLVLGAILRVFVNTYTADDKYHVQDFENSPLPIQMQLSEKRKTFSQFFVPFLESTSNFKHFARKDDRHS